MFTDLSHHRTCRSAYGGFALSLSSVISHKGYRHFLSIVRIRPIFLKGEFLFGHLTTNPAFYTILPLRQCAIRPFTLTGSRSATSASADFSTLVVTILA
ncbi:hypothetical protein VPJ68_16515, partial [Parabacteroides distasonis]